MGELQDVARVVMVGFWLLALISAAVLVRMGLGAWEERREMRRLTKDGRILYNLNRGRAPR